MERVLARYPLSRDQERYERLRDDLALYRLTLGQASQEDMVELLRKRGGRRASVCPPATIARALSPGASVLPGNLGSRAIGTGEQ